jgi:hypothetical protein
MRDKGLALIFEAMAYALAGMFLLAGLVNKSTVLIVCGWVFIAFATLLVIAAIINRSGWIPATLRNGLAILLFAVTWVEFFAESVNPEQSARNVYVVVAAIFLLLLTIGMVISVIRDLKSKKKEIG